MSQKDIANDKEEEKTDLEIKSEEAKSEDSFKSIEEQEDGKKDEEKE